MKPRVLARLAAGLSIVPSVHLSAQVALHLSAGLRYSSPLVRDSIVTPFTFGPALAPALALSAAYPLNPPWVAEASLDFSRSNLHRRDQDGPTLDAGPASTVAFTVGLRRHWSRRISARFAVGGLRYAAGHEGIFRLGTGGVLPVAALAVAYSPPRFGARHALALEARYDAHRFNTPALRSEGFVGSRIVHRLAITARAGWQGSR